MFLVIVTDTQEIMLTLAEAEEVYAQLCDFFEEEEEEGLPQWVFDVHRN